MGLDMLKRKRPARKRTGQQEAFIQAVIAAFGRAFVLEALAGTGKTSSLEMLAEDVLAAHPKANILYLVYGKKAEQEAAGRFGRSVRTKTTHAWALDVLRRAGLIEPPDAEMFQRMFAKGKALTDELPYPARWAVRQAAEVACEMGVGLPGGAPDTEETFVEIFRSYPKCKLRKSVDIHDAARWARDYFWKSIQQDPPTFGEMLWKFVASADQITWDSPDLVMVDEIQDWSVVQRLLLKAIAAPHFVEEAEWPTIAGAGDPHQAIFGWRGADAKSFEHMVAAIGAKVFPLTVSWRCSKAVIAEAQRVVPAIQAADSALDGAVVSISKEDLDAQLQALLPEAGRTAAVICRNNAPLFDLAIRLVKNNIPMRLQTKDEIVKNIPETVREAYKGAYSFSNTEPLTALLRKRLGELEDKPMASEEAVDQIEIARKVVEAVFERTVPNDLDHLQKLVADVIRLLFRPTSAERHIVLTTIHSSKGLEWDDVLLMLDQLPSRGAKRSGDMDALKQELNLLYVAITRAKDNLIYQSDSDDPLRQILNRFPEGVFT